LEDIGEGLSEVEEGDNISENGLDISNEDFDLGNLDNFTVDNVDVPKDSDFDNDETRETQKTDEKDEDKKSRQKKDNHDLNDNERKQIVITLSTLPKEAKKKIIEAIVSNKYSDDILSPLIETLVENEKPQNIIKAYEKITGDLSLSKIPISKFTGSDFEERKKSLGYVFQKNILPIISRIAAVSLLSLMLIFVYTSYIYPTMEASKYYKLGKKNIREKKFWDVEPYFEKAYSIQPRYKEVVEYARLYRLFKRYLEAEKKYYFAMNIKQSDPLKLEFADFFREIKDFERSIKLYEEMIRKNGKDIKARLGLAKTFLDYSNESLSQINNAKEEYLNVLDIDGNNFEATFGLLDINLRQKNHKEIMKHYRYIEKKFKKKVDPVIYSNLADYLLDVGEVDDIKNILMKAHKNSNGLIYPEIDYLFARYKKFMNINNEERNHLENAVKKFEAMKQYDPFRFELPRYREILSKVYNDLGESYERFSKINIKAEEFFLKSIEANPEYGKPYYNLGNFALKNKVDYEGALKNYLSAEKNGFSNDTQNFNMGWLYYKKEDYKLSYQKINKLLDKFPDNSNLKFMIGTIFYKIGNYDLSEGMLLETYNYFESLRQMNYPVDMSTKEGRMIITMLTKVSNNLGAALQKKYEQTKNSKYIVWSTKYYSDGIEFFSMMKDIPEDVKNEENFQIDERVRYKKFDIENANQNLRMVLYPDAGFDEPILYEDFTLDFRTTM
ncbi:MAG TPA: hypothetical protein PK771_09150, partial [Spirochaetota bacterium]|nr:hypothetical protein [Spirochaetota bacterium]